MTEVRHYLGIETKRQWIDRAIAPPMLRALFSLMTIIADDIHKTTMVVRSARWHAGTLAR